MAQQAQANAPKVGSPAPEGQKPKKQKREKKSRPEIPAELVKRNEAGKLTEVPIKWTRQYKALKEKDFADEATFIEFKAHLLQEKIKDDQARIAQMREEAKSIRKIGGNEKVKKTVRKVQKMRAAMAEMMAALKEEGIEI